MKIALILVFCFSQAVAYSQTKYQIGVGAGYSFLQSVNLKTGTVGLKFKSDRNVFIDFNKTINENNSISWGAQARMNITSYLYEPDKALPYYSEKPHIPIFDFESLELHVYLKKSFTVLASENDVIHFFVNIGPGFNINEGDFNISNHSTRDDNGQSFQIYRNVQKAQKLYIPYLRVTGGLEILKKFRKKYYLGISPNITWVGLQSENNDVTVLRDDPVYISTVAFKRTRSGYGVKLIFSK